MLPKCTHPDGHVSGQLRRDRGTGLLSAWLVCDDCGETVSLLSRQTTDLQRERGAAGPVAAPAAA